MKEPTGIEIQIALPIAVGLAEVEAGGEIQAKTVIKRAPDFRVAALVKLRLGPAALAPHRCRWSRKIKGQAFQIAQNQRVGVKKQERGIGQGSQRLYLVAIWVALAKDLVFKGQKFSPQCAQLAG